MSSRREVKKLSTSLTLTSLSQEAKERRTGRMIEFVCQVSPIFFNLQNEEFKLNQVEAAAVQFYLHYKGMELCNAPQ